MKRLQLQRNLYHWIASIYLYKWWVSGFFSYSLCEPVFLCWWHKLWWNSSSSWRKHQKMHRWPQICCQFNNQGMRNISLILSSMSRLSSCLVNMSFFMIYMYGLLLTLLTVPLIFWYVLRYWMLTKLFAISNFLIIRQIIMIVILLTWTNILHV